MNRKTSDRLGQVLQLLDLHHDSFYQVAGFAKETGHPVPSDSRGWSQIVVSLLTGIRGRDRKKGTDLEDGSDVKAANTWEAIDTPRFNGVIKAGTKAESAGKLESLDKMPFLFLVLWDHSPSTEKPRCRIWCVRPKRDKLFRKVCKTWYGKRDAGAIVSANFQLHPPREKDSNEIRNESGTLLYPLLLCAERRDGSYGLIEYHPEVLTSGECSPSTAS